MLVCIIRRDNMNNHAFNMEDLGEDSPQKNRVHCSQYLLLLLL